MICAWCALGGSSGLRGLGLVGLQCRVEKCPTLPASVTDRAGCHGHCPEWPCVNRPPRRAEGPLRAPQVKLPKITPPRPSRRLADRSRATSEHNYTTLSGPKSSRFRREKSLVRGGVHSYP